MRKYRQTILCMACLCIACLSVSCSDSGVEDEFDAALEETVFKRTMKVSSSTVNFTPSGGSQSVYVTSENVDWEVGSLAAWVSASPRSGNKSYNVTFTAAQNNNIDDPRSHITSISSIDKSLGFNFPITISQNAQKGYITPDVTSVPLSASAQSYTVDITSNLDWTCKCSSSWVTLTKYSSFISITVTENTNLADAREATISLQDSKTGKEYSTIKVTQKAPSKITVPDVLTFSADGGAKSFSITSEVAYSIISSNNSWLTTSPSSGTAGTRTITVSVTKNNEYNERNGSIYIRVDGNNAATINVTQEAATRPAGQQITDLYKSNDTFTSKGGNLTLTFNTTGSWSITKPSTASWLTLSSTSGTNSASITVRAADNPSVYSREATLTIKPANGTAVETKFTQSGRYLTLSSEDEITMFAKGGTSNPITVYTDGTWSVSSSNTSWLTVSKSSSSFTITARENTTGAQRSGTITVELTGLTDSARYYKTIKVTQLLQGELYLNGSTSGTADGTTSFTINITNYGNDEDWNGQISK